jgi:hypothetical protein
MFVTPESTLRYSWRIQSSRQRICRGPPANMAANRLHTRVHPPCSLDPSYRRSRTEEHWSSVGGSMKRGIERQLRVLVV